MDNNKCYGATPDDWDHLELLLGAGDLLPVVSKPGAAVSPKSTLQEVGKTPSLYNREGYAVGIKDWTSKVAESYEVERWSKVSDLGICIQTRHVRAIDIDVTDALVADDIEEFVTEFIGLSLPARRRSNSSKCLLAFIVDGDWGKRRVEVAGGIVEVLMNGQQFIAVGTHPSGVRYEWDGGLPDVVPVLSVEAFEALWGGLVDRFAVGDGPGVVTAYKERSVGLTRVLDDPIKDYLVEHDLVLSSNAAGDVFIECPWKGEHSDGGLGEPGTSTVWMVAGGNGHGVGHFKCLHAHCAGRTDDEFIEAIGAREVCDQVVIDMFPVAVKVAGESDVKLVFKRNEKTGEILPEFINITTALGAPSFTGFELGYDTFRDEVMMTVGGRGEWVSFGDHHYTELWLGLVRRGFKELDYAKLKLAVYHVAMSNAFDSAQLWLNGLVWDGVGRVEGFMRDYMGTEDTEYARSISRYMWTALAGRVLCPGVKADMVPIYIGKQGVGKSTAVAALSPAAEYFGDVSLADKDAEIGRKIRGKVVIELPELKGLKGKDMEHIKALITRTAEDNRKLYKEYYSKYYRRNVFFGTTNEDEFLSDDTGNRRWLPIEVGVAGEVDVGAIVMDCKQLWAEAREIYLAQGVEYAVAENLGRVAHEEYVLTDPWQPLIEEWLVTPRAIDGYIPEKDGVIINDFITGVLKIEDRNISRREQLRVSSILKKVGYVSKVCRRTGRLVKRWVHKDKL
jgi:hypothetical protein